MFRTGILTLDDVEVYGTLVPRSDGLRFRCWSREWVTLGYHAGQSVGLRHGCEPERTMLIVSVVALADGNTWIDFGAPIHRPRLPLFPDRPRSRRVMPGRRMAAE